MTDTSEVLKRTLDVMMLRSVVFGDAAGHSTADATERDSENVHLIEDGALYCGRLRMEDRERVSLYSRRNNNDLITKSSVLMAESCKQLRLRTSWWREAAQAIALVMHEAPTREHGEQ